MIKIKQTLTKIPNKPGIYQFYDKNNALLYIGKAKNLKNRVKSYWQKSFNLSPAKQQMVKQIKNIKYTIVSNETEALLLEKTLIRKHQPPFNIDLRDDKYWLYIKIDLNDPFPKVETVRRFEPQNKVKYFGPYTSAAAVHRTIKLLKKIFAYRACNRDLNKLPNGPLCLQYHMGKCLGPCEQKCSRTEYQQMIKQIIEFLSGKTNNILNWLKQKMDNASKKQDYELAALYRNQIAAINSLQTRQRVIFKQKIQEDFISVYQFNENSYINLFKVRQGKLIDKLNFTLNNRTGFDMVDVLTGFVNQYYPQTTDWPKAIIVPTKIETELSIKIIVPQKGDKKRLLSLGVDNAQDFCRQQQASWEKNGLDIGQALTQLQKGLKLKTKPRRIEIYDISNIQGVYAVGSMVVFVEGKPAKSQYRKFQIKQSQGPDDSHMMQELISRRLQHQEWPAADLIILDGGKSQLSTVLKLPNINKNKIIALSKKEEQIHTPDKKTLQLKKNTPAYFLMQRMRDKAHRFAINYYRARHKKETIASKLDNLPGIGPKTKKIVKQKYGSWANIQKVGYKELTELIGQKKATIIKRG